MILDKEAPPLAIRYVCGVDDMSDFLTYPEAMSDSQAILTLRIDTEKPIELDSFVGAFTSLAEEYRREMRSQFPDIDGDARIFVKEIRKGSYVAYLIPYVTAVAPLISGMDYALIVEKFVKVWGGRIAALSTGELGEWRPTKRELGTFTNAVKAVANDPSGKSTLEAATFEDERLKVRSTFTFSTDEARKCQETIDSLYWEEDTSDEADHERVLMVFTRTDVGDVAVGKRSGERVVIGQISNKHLAIMYSSKLAEGRIKYEIREADENVYKKGFVVDVRTLLVRGRPSVYAITALHSVMDLPEDE